MERDQPSSKVLDYLDAHGLPWRLSYADLVARYGVSRNDAIDCEAIQITTLRPLLAGLVWPFWVRISDQLPPALPATCFCSMAHLGPDPRENFALTYDQLARVLGPGVASPACNVIGRIWHSGRATLTIDVFPPDLQSYPRTGAAFEREPRLAAGCWITIGTGFQLRASDRERSLVAGFVPLATLSDRSTAAMVNPPVPLIQTGLEFIRQAEPAFDVRRGQVGISADLSTLIFSNTDIYLVPLEDVLRYEVVRILPAKGGGGSWLMVQCRDAYGKTKAITVAVASGPDELTGVAEKLGDATCRPVVLHPYTNDV